MGNCYFRIKNTGLVTISYNIAKDRVVVSTGQTVPIELWNKAKSRRTFATLAYKKGIPSLAIMAITGHKTEKSFLTYIKVSQQEQADIFRRYSDG